MAMKLKEILADAGISMEFEACGKAPAHIVDREIRREPHPRVQKLKDVFMQTLSSANNEFPYWYSREYFAHGGEIWMIPETRRATVFEHKKVGDRLNIEIERSTQVVVDTVREAVQESLGRLQPVLEALLKEKGLSLDDFVQAPVLPH